MLIFVALVIIILTGSKYVKTRNYKKSSYFYVVFLAMLIIVGLRDITVGKVDTQYIYTPRITKYFSYSYSEIWRYQAKDRIFYMFTKFLSNRCQNINFIIFCLSIPFLVSVVYLIKKHSKNACLSLIAFLGLQYFTMSFFLLRQVIATAFCIFAFEALINKKTVLFVVLVMLGSTFHQTALIFLLAYPLSLLQIGLKQWLAVSVSFIISLVARQSFVSRLFLAINSVLSEANRYAYYEFRNTGLGYTGFAIQLGIFICITYAYHSRETTNGNSKRMIIAKHGIIKIRKTVEEKNKTAQFQFDDQVRIMYNFATASLALMAFSSIIGEFWRAASYFGIYNILLLPNAINSMKSSKQRKNVSLIVGTGLILYFLLFHLSNAQVIPYKFFWQ